jgi:anti-anti-sigma factor
MLSILLSARPARGLRRAGDGRHPVWRYPAIRRDETRLGPARMLAAEAAGGHASTQRRRSVRSAEVQSNFKVEVHGGGKAVVVNVCGELDLASSPALEQELESQPVAAAPMVIVDLRQLEFMDSTGLSVLVRAHQRAVESGQRFGVVKGPQQVQRLLSLTGVAERLTVGDSPEELLPAE